MKIKLDENLPVSMASHLRTLGHDVDTTLDEQLTGRPDTDVWNAAQRELRFLVTQDLDFSDIRTFEPGKHKGILLVRLHAPDRQSLIQRVRSLFETEQVEAWSGCFVVATERKVRIVRAGSTEPT